MKNHLEAMKAVAKAEIKMKPSILKLDAKEICKIGEILEMSADEVAVVQKRFTTVHKVGNKKVIIKDWLDDSIQIVNIK